MPWIDLTKEAGLNKRAYRELPVGKVLVFTLEGSETHLKIMRKYKGKIWGKEVFLYKEEEVSIKDNR